jgi:dihydroneopterin aldolase
MDTVFINDLQVATIIGVNPWEREVQQVLWLDLELGMDNRRSAATDDLALAVNYDAVCQRVTAHIEASRCELIETLAEQVAELLLGEFGLPWLRLRLRKPGAVGNAREVGVQIERGERC